MNRPIPKPQGSYISSFNNLVKDFGGINSAYRISGFMHASHLKQSIEDGVDYYTYQFSSVAANFKLVKGQESYYTKCFKFNRDLFLVVQGTTEEQSIIFKYRFKKFYRTFSVLSFKLAYEHCNEISAIYSYSEGLNLVHSLYHTTDTAKTLGEHFSENYICWLHFNIISLRGEDEKATKLIDPFMKIR